MTDSNKTRYTEFDALVERHQGLIRSLCWRDAGGDAGMCADLMQEVLMQLWRQRHRLRAGVSRGEEREWVRLQTRNVLQHHRRHPLPPLVSLDEAAQVAVDAVDHRAELEALAAGLSEQEHRLLQLLTEGYSQVEIAALWQMHPDSVGRLKRQMIEKMKKNI